MAPSIDPNWPAPSSENSRPANLDWNQLDRLNQVLSSTLIQGKTNIDCTADGKLVVTGDNIKLSELKPRLVEMCPNPINSGDIVASNTLFVDSDLDGVGSQLQLTLSAPKWEVVGQRRINLDGSAGAAPNPPKARNSDRVGINPEKGRPGQPGGNAGSFLGLVQQFVNREGLTITANGGAGGAGQEGGDAHDGERGTDAPVPDQWCHFNAPYEVTWTKSEMHGFTNYNYTTYRIYGTDGRPGGVGGDGGAGGAGGQKGVIELYNLDWSNKQTIDTKPGNNGPGGRGGIGGLDGLHGDDREAYCEFYFTWGIWTNKYTGSSPLPYSNPNRQPNGKDGANHDQNVRVSQIVPLAQFSKSGSLSSVNLDWNRFLDGLYSKLGEYQFQQNPRRYNVANVEHWGDGETKPQNINIDQQNFNQFMHKLSPHNISGHDSLKDTQVAQWQLDQLNQVLSLTLKQGKTNIDCSADGKLVVTGDNIKLSELKPRLVEMCPNPIDSVNIFASNTLFVDSDLDGVGSQLKLTLSAPKWEVVGLRRINLNGSAGAAPNPSKARNSDQAGINPEKGRPGQPGGAAGSFLGLAQQFVNRQGLIVTANGGAGGAGQEGGDAHDGERGRDAPVPDQWCHFNAPYDVTWTKTEMHGFTQYNYTDYRIYGTDGTPGGVGGDGGAGGAGGQKGVIEFYNLDGSNKQTIDTKPGNDGTGGRGGIGGLDGLHGNDLAAHCEFYFTWGIWTNKYTGSEPIPYSNPNRQPNGKDGANHDLSVRVSQVVPWNLANPINEFKNYLRSKQNDVNERFMGLSTILDQLEKNNVERQIDSLVTSGLNHSTESLLPQIAKYAETIQQTGDMNHIKKKLNYLSTVDKLYNLNSSPEPNMIYDLDGFLYYVDEIINILNKLRNQKQRPEHEMVQQQLANLIVNMNSAQFTSATDPQLVSVAKELESLIRSTFVLQQYDSLVVALKQLIFPYAHLFIDEKGFNRNSTDIEYLINSAIDSLSQMKWRVVQYKTTFWRVDKYEQKAIFDSSIPLASPFHVWLNGENRNAIGRLLSGVPVILNADIRASDSGKDAIKFTQLEINLKAPNTTAQAEINAELNKFLVSATQLGNSNYRYGDKYYLIKNVPLNIEYSFAKDSNGMPEAYNEVYRKIKSGVLMASPYAMWQIQLSKMNEMVSFERLAAYSDDVDLELVGEGIYRESVSTRNDYLQVDQHYSEYVDDTKAQLDSNVAERQSAKVMKVNSLHRSSDRVPEQVSNSTGPLSYIARLGQTVSNMFNSTVNTHRIAHPRFDYTKQHNANTNSMTESSNSLDVQGNLLLGQLLVGLIAGKNGSLSSESFISPEQARTVQVESLAQRVLPVLSQSSVTQSSQVYNSNNQWYRDWNDTSRN